MKKIAAVVFVAAVCLSSGVVMAQKENEFPAAKDVKIHKKQILSKNDRKALDEAKGKSVNLQEKEVATFLAATGVSGDPLPSGGERYAIVVGLANYIGTVNDLCVLKAKTRDQFPEDNDNLTQYCQDYDSVHMSDALLNEYGFTNIVHLHDGYATQEAILAAMENLKNNDNLDSNDEVVFFFSGHGTTGIYGAADEDVDEGIYVYDGKVIWDDQLKNWADSLSVSRIVFAFDICMAGGMNELADGNNRLVTMSSGETQNSWTYYLGGYNAGTKKSPEYKYSEGLFSHWFVLEGMTNDSADGVNVASVSDNLVAVEEAFGYTYPIVFSKQIPTVVDNFFNDLVL